MWHQRDAKFKNLAWHRSNRHFGVRTRQQGGHSGNLAMDMQVESLADGIIKVNLAGRLDIAGAERIDLHFSVVSGAHRKVIVDLEKVSFLASMGIRTLIIGAKSMRSKGSKMVILNPTPDVEKVLVISGTDTLIPIVHDLIEAIAAVSD
jgi:anti-sigma B factor antagonist